MTRKTTEVPCSRSSGDGSALQTDDHHPGRRSKLIRVPAGNESPLAGSGQRQFGGALQPSALRSRRLQAGRSPMVSCQQLWQVEPASALPWSEAPESSARSLRSPGLFKRPAWWDFLRRTCGAGSRLRPSYCFYARASLEFLQRMRGGGLVGRFRSSPTYFIPGDRRRDESRRGTQECARHELILSAAFRCCVRW
jgi:hypothetical protein